MVGAAVAVEIAAVLPRQRPGHPPPPRLPPPLPQLPPQLRVSSSLKMLVTLLFVKVMWWVHKSVYWLRVVFGELRGLATFFKFYLGLTCMWHDFRLSPGEQHGNQQCYLSIWECTANPVVGLAEHFVRDLCAPWCFWIATSSRWVSFCLLRGL